MAEKKILILGAGLAGLSAAWHLQKKGISCRIFEKEALPGGLCRTKSINNFLFDCDGHLLHFRHPYSFNLIKSLLGENLVEHARNAWVYSHQRFIPFPFQAHLNALPSRVAKECREGFIRAQHNGKHLEGGANFAQWIGNTFGPGIARHFMLPYNRKFWTVPPQELTCDWLDGFISVPSLKQVLEGKRVKLGYNSRFWYPKNGGIEQLARAFCREIKDLQTNCAVESINLKKKEIKFSSGNKEKFDILISTLPLPELERIIQKIPAPVSRHLKNLKWNSILNLNLGIEKKDSSKRHWVYFPQKDISFFRVGFYHNFSSSLAPENRAALYVEAAYPQNISPQKDKAVARIKDDLLKAGIIVGGDKILAEDINNIKYGYPIYDRHYARSRAAIIKYLKQNSVIPCGRYGSWQYLSMEGAILEGRRAARISLQ